MEAENVDAGALACAWYARDAYAARVAGVGQTLLYNFLRECIVVGREAFYQSDRAAQYCYIAFEDAFHKL